MNYYCFWQIYIYIYICRFVLLFYPNFFFKKTVWSIITLTMSWMPRPCSYESAHLKFVTGEIPASLFNISSLWYIDLRRNNFSGTLPESVSNSTLLEELYLTYNSLTGTFYIIHYGLISLLYYAKRKLYHCCS